MLERHVVFRLEAEASAEDVDYTEPLSCKCIDDWSVGRHDWGFEEVGENGQHAVEALILVVGLSRPLDANALAELAENDEVEDDGRGEERVLTRVVHDNRVGSA